MADRNKSLHTMFTGHRGSGANTIQSQLEPEQRTPENSLASIKKALAEGVDVIEFDLYKTNNDRLVVTHDNDLSKTSKKRNGADTSELQKIDSGKYHVEHLDHQSLQSGYDISNVPVQDDKFKTVGECQTGQHITDDRTRLKDYHTIPLFTEVLEAVAKENLKRKKQNKPNVKLNIELKGQGTGNIVQGEIASFNAVKSELEGLPKINSDDIHFLSFSERELYAAAQQDPKANLILGVPTFDAYKETGKNYSIKNKELNKEHLDYKIDGFDSTLKNIPGRGRGLDGVDMNLWDVGDEALDYFGQKQMPISVAVTPWGPDHLNHEYLLPALDNIDKIRQKQEDLYSGKKKTYMFVKTDSPTELQKIIEQRKAIEGDEQIISAKEHLVGSKEKATDEEEKIPLYKKPHELFGR